MSDHDLIAEQAVLGAILLADQTLYALAIEDGLKAEDFYREQHRVVYAAVLELYEAGEPIDALTLTGLLRETGRLQQAGGEQAINALAGAVPMAAHVRRYAKQVRDLAVRRRLRASAAEILQSLDENAAPVAELIDRAEQTIMSVGDDDRRRTVVPIGDVLHDELEALHELSRTRTSLTGVASGFVDLDALTGGFQPGNLIVLAARPSMGKSALATNIAENAAVLAGRPVLLCSLEMSRQEVAQRLIASQARVKGEELRKGRVAENRWPKIAEAANLIARSPLYIDDSADVGILDVAAKARRLRGQHPDLGMVIVDYLQLMRPDPRIDSRTEQVSRLSRGLKILAQELAVPIIALAQLNRGVEARMVKVPMLSDLRESGAIEQDADLVMFVYREDYYDPESSRAGEADIIVAKHRNGATGDVTLTFQGQYPRFMSAAQADRYAA